MEEPMCPFMCKPCDGSCALYDADDDIQACAILSIAKSMGRVAFEFDERDSLLITALNGIGDAVHDTI